MKLALSTLLASIALLSPQALAMGGGSSIDLQYAVRNGEALYGVATANGDLRFMNQGPSAAKLRWFDPLRGEEETRVLHPGQALLSHGHFGVPISEGTVILVEKVGQGPISTGLASIPSSVSMHDSVHCLHNNGAFLPWHRGYLTSMETFLPWHREYFTSGETIVGGTMCSIESYRGILGTLSSWNSDHSSEAQFVLGDGTVRFLVDDKPQDLQSLLLQQLGDQEGEPMLGDYPEGMLLHDSVHCIVGGTMCSASASNDYFSHNPEWLALLMIQKLELESGHTLPIAISLEISIAPTDGDDIFMPNAEGFFAGIPSCPELEHGPGPHPLMYIDDASSNLGGQEGAPFMEPMGHILWTINESGSASLEHGPGMHDSIHSWLPCPPYEPCDDVTALSIWTSGTASIWSDGTFTSIAPDGTVDL